MSHFLILLVSLVVKNVLIRLALMFSDDKFILQMLYGKFCLEGHNMKTPS